VYPHPLFPPHETRPRPESAADRFPELHLYLGSRCNRACFFCTVRGEPDGWIGQFSPELVERIRAWVAPEGNLKLYGGEPTLEVEAVLALLAELRRGGFAGWFTVFTNGVQAERVIRLLEADPRLEVVLNHSILYGLGVEPLPPASRALLIAAAPRFPGRIFASHADLAPAGRALTPEGALPDQGLAAFGGQCPRCWPVLTARGELYACPFPVEDRLPHHHLGEAAVLRPPEAVAGHRSFLDWIERELEPRARAAGVHPCRLCAAPPGGAGSP